MHKSPLFVALAAAGVIAVAHAAIAAIGSPNITESNVAAPTQQIAGASAEVTGDQATPPANLAVAPAIEPASAGRSMPLSDRVAQIAKTDSHANGLSATFPSAATEISEPLPAVAAYFDRKDANTLITRTTGSPFPSAAVELAEPLPAVVAYFDKLEDAQRMATDAAKARVTTYVDSLAQKVAANAARENVTAYVESLSQKLAFAPLTTVATSELPARSAR